MRCIRSTTFLLILLTSVLEAQWDTTDRILDLRNKTALQKATSKAQTPDNIIAEPILALDHEELLLPMVKSSSDKNSFYSSILLGDDVESYVLFQDVVWSKNTVMTISSPNQLWLSKTYTSKDVKKSGRLMIGPLEGDIDIELDGGEVAPKIQQVYTREINQVAMDFGFDASFGCHTNINCEEGQIVSQEKRAVMRIRMVTDIGVALCTGTLLNNTSADRTPYVLTAYHCIIPPDDLQLVPFYDMWWFDFNYESPSCANPDEEPAVYAVQGAELLAQWEDTDMMLLKITQDIPSDANVYYAGWNRDTTYLADTTYLIHHPQGDIKKVSFDYDPATIHDNETDWNNGAISSASSHIRNQFDGSTYEQGSSGGSIFDTKGHVLGQLHGGPLTDPQCELGVSYCGRFGWSWETGDDAKDRLMDWLDPEGSAPLILDGIDTEKNELIRITGRLTTPLGLPIPNVRVEMVGDRVASISTGSDGRFVFEGLDPDGTYEFSFEKNTDVGNGLSASDLILIRNHVVGLRTITDEYSLAAADVSRDGAISGGDIIQIRNIIIGSQERFPQSKSWNFQPNNITMNPQSTNRSNMDLEIIGFKMGDVNNSALPNR